MPEPREFMLIFKADHFAADAHGRYRATQIVSPRVVIVEPNADVEKEELLAINGVVAVLAAGENPPVAVSETLSSTEALFVNAYAQRSGHKTRPGEGLDWDAKEFLPPHPRHKPFSKED